MDKMTKTERKTYNKIYKQKNKNNLSKLNKIYYQLHKKEIKKQQKEYYKNNKTKIMMREIEYCRKKYHNNTNFKILVCLRHRLNLALKNSWKFGSTLELIGCSISFLKKHLESQFKENMTWQNYGKWHIDHIIPCASFDLSKPEEQKKCFNYTNLQPLWAKDNIIKKDKIISMII
jgi:reverse gyrase